MRVGETPDPFFGATGSPARGISSMNEDGSTSASSSRLTVDTVTRTCGDRRSSRNRASAAPRAVLFRRPAERGQQRRGIENVSFRPIRPLALDKADKGNLVELAVSRRLIVDELDPRAVRIRYEGLLFNPPSNTRRHRRDVNRRIVVRRVRAGERVENVAHRRSSPAQAGAARIGFFDWRLVCVEKPSRHCNCDDAGAAAVERRQHQCCGPRGMESRPQAPVDPETSCNRSSPPR